MSVSWPGTTIVDTAYGAEFVEAADGDRRSASVILAPTSQGADAAFVLMGHGTTSMPTSFSCTAAPNGTGAAASLNSGASAIDCDLGARWALSNPYPQLSDAKVYLDRWEAGRTIVLSFSEVEFNVINVQYATARDTEVDDRTVVAFELGQLGTERLCHTGHVGESGQYVRDVNCAGSAAAGAQQLFFSFQLQCPTCTTAPEAPVIVCHELSPPPPVAVHTLPQQSSSSIGMALPLRHDAPTTYGSRTPSGRLGTPPPPPPPQLSLPPGPPRVQATSCTSGGMAEVQRHIQGDGEQETLRIVVRPTQWWPTGYDYVVGLRGLGLHVWRPEGATLQLHEQHNFDEMAIHHFTFTPEQAHPNFAFNVDGIDVILVSLTCGLPDPPPSRPLDLTLPPSPPPSMEFRFTYGLRSLSSRVAVGVLALLIGGRLLSSCWLLLRRRFLARSVISADDGNSRGRSGLPVSESAEDCWSVLILLGGEEVELSVSQTIANNSNDLKHALADLAREALGPTTTPAAWLEGDLRSMCVRYVDIDDRSCILRSGTRFAELCESPYLRVTKDPRANQ